MIRIPETRDEAVGFVGKALWWGSRLHLIAIAIGIAGTVAVQLLTGFWTFRSEHQATIRAQYDETRKAHTIFQQQIERFNAVFEGAQNIEGEIGSYSEAAQTYIRQLKEASRLLPGTNDEIADYIDAITNLRQYYVVDEPPEVGSLDWVIYYGKFRTGFDRFIQTRDAYLEELASELGGYWRAVFNS